MKTKNEKGRAKDRDENKTPSMLSMSDIKIGVSPSLLEVKNNLRSVGDYAAGLSFGLPNESIFSNYTKMVEEQRRALTSVLEIGENFKLEGGKITSILDNTLLPLNSAITEIGLIGVNASKLHSLGSIDLRQLQFSNKVSELAFDTIQGQQDIMNTGIDSIKSSGVLKTINEISPALQIISGGISEMMRALPTYPTSADMVLPELEIAREDTEIDKSDISEHQTKLDALLEKINPDLVEFRKGAWEAFNGKGKDYIGQASSSMRRLVDTLLREIAPSEKVTKADFFKTSPKTKDDKNRPTRKARIMFAIKWDQNKSNHLERLTNGFLESYGNLSAWDHVPLKKDSFVHGALITIEGYLISILSENQE